MKQQCNYNQFLNIHDGYICPCGGYLREVVVVRELVVRELVIGVNWSGVRCPVVSCPGVSCPVVSCP